MDYVSVLKDSWKKPELSVQFCLEKIPKEENENENAEELTEAKVLERYLKDKEFAHWYEQRKLWAEKEIPVRQAMTVYNQFYELYARLERESEQYELVLGNGLLYWDHASGLIKHPILLLRLKLEFDPSIPEFSLLETEQPTELYNALFRTVPEVTGTVMSRLQEN